MSCVGLHFHLIGLGLPHLRVVTLEPWTCKIDSNNVDVFMILIEVIKF